MRPAHEWVAHARQLAKQWGIRMLEDSAQDPNQAHVDVKNRTVLHAPIDSEFGYATSLHEMGHVVSPNGLVRDQIKPRTALEKASLCLVEEEAAWDWARANALEWTPEMERNRVESMRTYIAAKRQLEGGAIDFEFEMQKLFDAMFGGGGPMAAGPFSLPMAPPVPQRPIDPQAATKMAPAHAATARSIVATIRKERSK